MRLKKVFLGSGTDFESFCAGLSRKEAHFKAFGPNYSQYRGDKGFAILESIQHSIDNGVNQEFVRDNKAFFWRVFSEVKQQLPKGMRHLLRMVPTLGTALDYFYSADFIFILGRNYVVVDVTLDLKRIDKQRDDSFGVISFSDFDLDRAAMVQISRTIAEKLRGYDSFDEQTFEVIKKMLYGKKN